MFLDRTDVFRWRNRGMDVFKWRNHEMDVLDGGIMECDEMGLESKIKLEKSLERNFHLIQYALKFDSFSNSS